MDAAGAGVESTAGALLGVDGPGEAAYLSSAFCWWRASSWSCQELRPDMSDFKEVKTAIMDKKLLLSIPRPGEAALVAGRGVGLSAGCLLLAACLHP